MKTKGKYDFIILGAGIIGLAVARELKQREPDATILVLEKESCPGKHASGRNSGILHSGIYYPTESLKAKVCAAGSEAMAAYCQEHGLPLQRVGKVVVPTCVENDAQVDLLLRRGKANGARVSLLDEAELKEIEPAAHTATGRALHSPDTAIIDPLAILKHLVSMLEQQGVGFAFSTACTAVDGEKQKLFCDAACFEYGHLYNTTGQYADRIAKQFGVGEQYTLIPFKGRYYSLSPDSGIKINGLIYPVPDLNVPFLGVHSVRNIAGESYFGPSAMPAFGRENYHALKGINATDASEISYRIMQQYWHNQQGFRQLLHEEAGRLMKSRFVAAAKVLVPKLDAWMLKPSQKVGIRPQLLNTQTHKLVMDFMVLRKENTTHVMNAISPAFTSAFAFAPLVVDAVE